MHAPAHQDRAARTQGARPDRARRQGRLALLPARLPVRDVARAAAPKSGTSTATASSISPPASPCARPATRTRRSCRRSRTRPTSSCTSRATTGTRGMVALGERLARSRRWSEPAMSFFCQSGTEAVEGALKLARYVTGRGRASSASSAASTAARWARSRSPSSKYTQQQGFFPTMPGVTHVPYPNPYRPLFAGDDQGEAVLDYIEDMLFAAQRAGHRGRGDPRRADPGRGRLPRAADGFLPACARSATSTASC